MVVHHDDAARSRENRGAKDLARVHERGIDDPTTHFLDGPYLRLRAETDDEEGFDFE